MNKLVKNYRQNPLLYWMLAPVLLYVLIFNYAPMFGLVISFQDYSLTRGVMGSKWIGLKNFEDFFSSMYFGRTLGNTLIHLTGGVHGQIRGDLQECVNLLVLGIDALKGGSGQFAGAELSRGQTLPNLGNGQVIVAAHIRH